MKACGIIGSPVKGGNVDLLVSEVLRGAESRGAEITKIYLNNMDIKPCQSCGVDPYPKYCIYEDDMELIYKALEECEIIVLGSPVYFDTVSAQVKLMIDRGNCLMPYIEQPDGSFDFERRIEKRKKGVFVSSAGIGQDFSSIEKTVQGFFNWANIELKEKILYTHDTNEAGSVRNEKSRMDFAYKIGARIIE